MIHIPQLTGLFDPVPFKEDPNADQNNLSTIGALQDPQGTLERKQAEQIAKASAGIKMEGIDQKYKGLAIDAIDEFQNKSKSMYAQNKGFNRLKLNAKQLLDEQHNYNELLTNINALKQLTADNRKTLEDVDNAFATGTITREDYDAFEKARLEAEGKIKSIGDIPSYRALYNNYLRTKPVKGVPGMYKTPEQWAELRNKPQTGELEKDYDPKLTKDQLLLEMASGEWQQSTKPMLLQTGVLKPGMSPSEELEAATQYAKMRFNPAENRKGGNTTIYNQSGGKDQFNPRVINKEGYTYYNFSAKPVPDLYGEYSGKYSTVRVGKDGKGEVFLSQIVNSKNEPIDVETDQYFSTMVKDGKARRDPNKAGGLWLPYSEAVEGSLQMGNINTNGIKVNYSEYTEPGGKPQTPGKPEKKNYLREIKPTDQISPASLVVGGVYKVGDELRKWNGSKLVKIQ